MFDRVQEAERILREALEKIYVLGLRVVDNPSYIGPRIITKTSDVKLEVFRESK
jgi:coenzyme F420-reducing hydrogenase beta subunit